MGKPIAIERHWNKINRRRKYGHNTSHKRYSKIFASRYKSKKLDLYLRELEDEINTVIAK
jgi:hypothetical protein